MKWPASVRSRVCFFRRSSLMIHPSSGSRRRIAASSAQSIEMLQLVAPRWRCTIWWFPNWKFPGGHRFNFKQSQTLLKYNDHMTCGLIKVIQIEVIGYKKNLCPWITRSVPFQCRGLIDNFCLAWLNTILPNGPWHSLLCQDSVLYHIVQPHQSGPPTLLAKLPPCL